MTDKQIIIDGKTIGCPCYINRTLYRYDKACLVQSQAFAEQQKEEKPILRCDKIKNCPIKENYKQLKRKEQECEELKKNVEHWKMEHKEAKAKGELTYDLVKKRLEQQLDKLKVENKKYSLFIEKLCDYAGLECDDEEQAMRTLSDLASQMNKAIWIIDRYKQTLNILVFI